MQENPNYYAVIPASVRYDNKLSPLARLLYGEISALCNKEGYCWASNNYFAKLYEVHKDTISRAIAELDRQKHLSIKIINRTERELRIDVEVDRIDEKVDRDRQKGRGGDRRKRLHNNTSNNNKINNTNTSSEVAEVIEKNEIYNYWEELISEITTTEETQRKASVSLLNKYGLEKCLEAIKVVAYAHSDQYARKEVKCNSLGALAYNWDKVQIYKKSIIAKRLNSNNTSGKGVLNV